MRRRRFIALLGSAALAWQPAARAQQSQMPVVGFLSAGAPEAYATRVAALRQGLNESGFTEGRNITIEYRWSHGENDRFPVLAADLVRWLRFFEQNLCADKWNSCPGLGSAGQLAS